MGGAKREVDPVLNGIFGFFLFRGVTFGRRGGDALVFTAASEISWSLHRTKPHKRANRSGFKRRTLLHGNRRSHRRENGLKKR